MRDWSNCLILAEKRLRKAHQELNLVQVGDFRSDINARILAAAEEHLTDAIKDLVDALAWVRSR